FHFKKKVEALINKLRTMVRLGVQLYRQSNLNQ
ncbi:MAG: hypothetical protein ACI9Q4_002679, partial [Sediminicola sp.]